jgi:hypothetical protein
MKDAMPAVAKPGKLVGRQVTKKKGRSLRLSWVGVPTISCGIDGAIRLILSPFKTKICYLFVVLCHRTTHSYNDIVVAKNRRPSTNRAGAWFQAVYLAKFHQSRFVFEKDWTFGVHFVQGASIDTLRASR